MKIITNVLLLLSGFLCLAQNQTEPHFVYGKTNTDAGVGTDYLFGCTLDVKEFLKKDVTLKLYGVILCDNENITYYKVFYNYLPYLVRQAEVNISEVDKEYLKQLTPEQDMLFGTKMVNEAEVYYKEIKEKAEKKIESYRAKGKQNGILIKKSNVFDQSEYTSGTGYNFSFINTSKKTIKYIWITVKGINAVNDVVSSKTLKGIGPLEPDTSASYSFDYVWYTDIVETCKIPLIKIQYMDGTVKQIQNADSLILSEPLYKLMYGDSDN